ncbi:MAG: RagB/SusD family nutrient uptake outer membrane protein [Breznakibacter sp.]
MKILRYIVPFTAMVLLLLVSACEDKLNEPAENKTFTEETDYTQSENMILPLIGLYAEFQDFAWENFPLIAVRGDDVNAGGLGDQQDFTETDKFSYNKDYWMYNSVWQNFYKDVFTAHSAIDQINLYLNAGGDAGKAAQYIAEARTIRAWELLQLSRLWGSVFIPENSDPSSMLVATPATKDAVMQHISDQMDLAVPDLPNMHPGERTDIRGGVTRYTALAIKALANLELKEYQKVADATSQIIASGKFDLVDDYYNLFKVPGKLSEENIFEMQYSDFGSGSGDVKNFPYSFFGPQGWTPQVTGAADGWGFYEPSLKYIKFMLDRGETIRLETSVLFHQPWHCQDQGGSELYDPSCMDFQHHPFRRPH